MAKITGKDIRASQEYQNRDIDITKIPEHSQAMRDLDSQRKADRDAAEQKEQRLREIFQRDQDRALYGVGDEDNFSYTTYSPNRITWLDDNIKWIIPLVIFTIILCVTLSAPTLAH